MAKHDSAVEAAQDPSKASSDVAEQMQKASDWPKPGDEGFVHPDGTPQAAAQLRDNQQAQADRDAIGAVAHGAPLATPGPQAGQVTAEKVQAASERDTSDDATTWVEKSLTETAQDVNAANAEAQAAAADSAGSGDDNSGSSS